MLRALLILCALIMSLLLVSCAAPLMAAAPLGFDAARAGASAYSRGKLRVARYATLDEAWQASHDALEQLQLVVHVQRTGQRRWYVMAKDENRGPEIQISLDRRSPVLTRISIRVGILGDLAVSSQVLRHIDAALLQYRDQRLSPDDESDQSDTSLMPER